VKRALLVAAAALGCIWLGAHPADSAPARHLGPLPGYTAALAPLPFPGLRYGVPAAATLRRDVPPGAYWGGPVTAASGDVVRVFSSTAYPQDDENRARLQGIADFLGGLPHQTELEDLDVYVVEPSVLAPECGDGAISCFGVAGNERGLMLIPAEWPAGIHGLEVMTHEYGHQIAAHRDNDPWAASTWGPKRWGTAMHVCERFADGTASPGDEGGGYKQNPGEAWAETYRVAVWGARATLPFSVDESFNPSAAALAAARRDVLQPWSGPATLTFRGRFVRPAGSGAQVLRTVLRVPTLLDGTLTAEIKGPPGATVALIDAKTGKVLRTPNPTVGMTVCGERAIRLVLRSRTPGAYRLEVDRP